MTSNGRFTQKPDGWCWVCDEATCNCKSCEIFCDQSTYEFLLMKADQLEYYGDKEGCDKLRWVASVRKEHPVPHRTLLVFKRVEPFSASFLTKNDWVSKTIYLPDDDEDEDEWREKLNSEVVIDKSDRRSKETRCATPWKWATNAGNAVKIAMQHLITGKPKETP